MKQLPRPLVPPLKNISRNPFFDFNKMACCFLGNCIQNAILLVYTTNPKTRSLKFDMKLTTSRTKANGWEQEPWTHKTTFCRVARTKIHLQAKPNCWKNQNESQQKQSPSFSTLKVLQPVRECFKLNSIYHKRAPEILYATLPFHSLFPNPLHILRRD